MHIQGLGTRLGFPDRVYTAVPLLGAPLSGCRSTQKRSFQTQTPGRAELGGSLEISSKDPLTEVTVPHSPGLHTWIQIPASVLFAL